jgi:predicted TIM-barrel fold metal-dependent hydrolase
MVIDIHAHTSARALWGFHTADASIAALEKLAQQYGIDRIYLMATFFPLKGTGLHNLELLERIRDKKLFGAFGSLNLEEDISFPLAELHDLAAKEMIDGIKLYPGYQDIALFTTRFIPLYRLAEKFSLPIAVHLGELHHCCKKGDKEEKENRCGKKFCPLDFRQELSMPEQLAKVARVFPSVKFIAAHLANPFFESLREVMEECHNVFTDISGQFVSGSAEDTHDYRRTIAGEITKFLQVTGGPERILFGTDFPIQSYKDSFEIMKMLELKPEIEKMIMGQNAQKLLPRSRKE